MESVTLLPLWHALGRQLENPRGLAGRVVGRLMGLANRGPTAAALAALGFVGGDSVLDLGFGPGHAVARIAARLPFGTVYGIDQSETMLAQASRRNRAAIRAGRVVLMQGDFERLPFPDASMDRILASNVIYFWRDIPAVLRELRRVLRPGGRVVIYATDAATMRRWKFAGPDTHRLFTRESLAALLRQDGFGHGAWTVRDVRLPGDMHGLLAIIDDREELPRPEKTLTG